MCEMGIEKEHEIGIDKEHGGPGSAVEKIKTIDKEHGQYPCDYMSGGFDNCGILNRFKHVSSKMYAIETLDLCGEVSLRI